MILFSVLITFLFLVGIRLIWKYLLNPYRLLKLYAKQGFTPRFYPYKGNLHFLQDGLKKNKNMLHFQINFAREHPNSRGIVFNTKEYVTLVLFDLKLRKAFYMNSDKYIKKESGSNEMLKAIMGEQNLLLSEHEEWKKRRKIISKAFTFDFVRSLSPFIVSTANQVFEEFSQPNTCEKVNIMTMFQEITGRSFVNSFFGQEMSGMKFEGENMTLALNKILLKYVVQAYQFVSFMFGGKFARNLKITDSQKKLYAKNMRFKEAIGDIIKSKHELFLKGELKSNNLLYIFFEQNKDLDSQLFDLIHEYITLYVAGTDTTGHLLTHMFFMLLKFPETKEKLMAEINRTPNLDDENISWESFQKMPYLHAFIKETFRIRSPVADIGFRVVLKDFMMDDILVKKGMVLQNGFISSCFDPKYFDEPDKFCPERWMEGGKNYKLEEEEPFLFIPFSAGNRNCIGQHLAKFEAMIIIVKFLKKFSYEWDEKKYDEKWVVRFLYELKDPLIVKLKKL